MTAADVSAIARAVLDSRPVRLATAVACQIAIVGFIGLMAAAIAIDIACGRGNEWPT